MKQSVSNMLHIDLHLSAEGDCACDGAMAAYTETQRKQTSPYVDDPRPSLRTRLIIAQTNTTSSRP